MQIEIRAADLQDPEHQSAIVDLLNMYASEPMGAGEPLPEDVQLRLIPGLQAQPSGRHFIAFVDEQPVGVAIGFLGFSTFWARPLLNIHDLAVRPELRGNGVGTALLHAIESTARDEGCCKVTLEVRADNVRARQLYVRFGFDPGQLDSSAMSFWSKKLIQ